MKKRRTHHLRVRDARETLATGDMTLRCLACGDEFTFLLPCSITMLTRVARQFERENASCRVAWDKARGQLLRVLDDRCWQLEAMEMERDWAEAKRRGEI